MGNDPVRSVIDRSALAPTFPTHTHEPAFWEVLGRAVATVGFLEEILGKAIFAFTATRPYDDAEVEQAYAAWIPTLERALTDPLGNLIDVYGKAVREHPDAAVTGLDALLSDLRDASAVRNILCHGSWGRADGRGAAVPFFVNRQMQIVDTAMDRDYLAQLQRHAADLACAVMDTVTSMGWRFPGSVGPGKVIR